MQEKKLKAKQSKKSSSFNTSKSSFSGDNPDIDGLLDDMEAKPLSAEEDIALSMISGKTVTEEQLQKAGVKKKKKVSSCGCF